MIYDLAAQIACHRGGGNMAGRMARAAEALPDVGVVALNGIPFVGDPLTYFGAPVSAESIHAQVRLGLGLGGALTSLSGADLNRLADISLDQGHDWAMRNIAATLCFAGAPTFVEMSFGRDGRFHMSWCEPRGWTDWSKPRVFTAAASLKVWSKYLANRNSNDFLNTQRRWLGLAHAAILPLCPPYFGTT